MKPTIYDGIDNAFFRAFWAGQSAARLTKYEDYIDAFMAYCGASV